MTKSKLLTAAFAIVLCQSGLAAPPDKAVDSSGSFHASCTAFANGSSTLGACSAFDLLDGEKAVVDSVSANCHQYGNSDSTDYRQIIVAQLRFPAAGSGDTAEIGIPLSVRGGMITVGNYDAWTTGAVSGPFYAEGTSFASSSLGLYFVRQYGTLTKSNVSCTLQVSGRLL